MALVNFASHQICTISADVILVASSSQTLLQVQLQEILNTGNFSMEKAATSPGWLQSLRDAKPATGEALEYSVSSFVYR